MNCERKSSLRLKKSGKAMHPNPAYRLAMQYSDRNPLPVRDGLGPLLCSADLPYRDEARDDALSLASSRASHRDRVPQHARKTWSSSIAGSPLGTETTAAKQGKIP